MSSFPQISALPQISTGVESRIRRVDTSPAPRLGVREGINQISLADPQYSSQTASLLEQLAQSLEGIGGAKRAQDAADREQQAELDRQDRQREHEAYKAQVERNRVELAMEALGRERAQQYLPTLAQNLQDGKLEFVGTNEEIAGKVRKYVEDSVGPDDPVPLRTSYIDTLLPGALTAAYNAKDVRTVRTVQKQLHDYQQLIPTTDAAGIEAIRKTAIELPGVSPADFEAKVLVPVLADAAARGDAAVVDKLAPMLSLESSVNLSAARHTLAAAVTRKQTETDQRAQDLLASSFIDLADGRITPAKMREYVHEIGKPLPDGSRVSPTVIDSSLRRVDGEIQQMQTEARNKLVKQQRATADSEQALVFLNEARATGTSLSYMATKVGPKIELADGSIYEVNAKDAAAMANAKQMGDIAKANSKDPQRGFVQQMEAAAKNNLPYEPWQQQFGLLRSIGTRTLESERDKSGKVTPYAGDVLDAVQQGFEMIESGHSNLIALNSDPETAALVDDAYAYIKTQPASSDRAAAFTTAINKALIARDIRKRPGAAMSTGISDADVDNAAADSKLSWLPSWDPSWLPNWASRKVQPRSNEYKDGLIFDTDLTEVANYDDVRAQIKRNAAILVESGTLPKPAALAEATKRFMENSVLHNGFAFPVDSAEFPGNYRQRQAGFNSLAAMMTADFLERNPDFKESDVVLVPDNSGSKSFVVLHKQLGFLMPMPEDTQPVYTTAQTFNIQSGKSMETRRKAIADSVVERIKALRTRPEDVMGGEEGKLFKQLEARGIQTLRQFGLSDDEITKRTAVPTKAERDADALKTRLMIMSR